ncbi:hypothetical protein PV408_42975 [Streptomyces sp. ME18-1-4]|nr:hypothetical protein [Streptomyces sp. ME18-1-4]MDX3248344.1 hypothetical protein [Streptomyces sp. ME18-1-4]
MYLRIRVPRLLAPLLRRFSRTTPALAPAPPSPPPMVLGFGVGACLGYRPGESE